MLILAIITLFYFLKRMNRTVFYLAKGETLEWFKAKVFRWRTSKAILFIPLLILAFNLSLYSKQRVEWMGDDNANFDAKEYWVAGQVVYAYRNIYCALRNHPDDLFIRPFTWLQEWIYAQGEQYIPPSDGERGVWSDIWFIYPYSRKFHNTKGVSGRKPSPRMIDLVNRTWISLQQQAEGTYADQQMMIQNYFRNFPGQAFYYISKKGFLTGRKVGSRELLVQNPKLLARDKQLIVWLTNLQKQWQSSQTTLGFLEKHPKVEAFLLLTKQMEAGDIIYGSIFSREFSCDSADVRNYVDFRKEFVGSDELPSARQRMHDKKQAQELYEIGVNTVISRFCNYTLERFCNIKVAGKEDMKDYTGWSKPAKEWREYKLTSIFDKEVEILEEIYHGR